MTPALEPALLEELIDVTKNMKTPSMRLVLKDTYTEPASIKELKSLLIHTFLGSIIKSIHFIEEASFFDSSFSTTDSILGDRLRETYVEPDVFCPWVGRLELEAPLMIRKGLTPASVAIAVAAAFPFHVSASLEHDDAWILKLRPKLEFLEISGGDDTTERSQQRIATEAMILKAAREVVLSGKPGISSCMVTEDTHTSTNNEGDIQSENITVIDTHGGSLADVLCMPQFRAELCTSNDIHDVAAVLGIEAATGVPSEVINQMVAKEELCAR